jgi:Rieske Fe-S protein
MVTASTIPDVKEQIVTAPQGISRRRALTGAAVVGVGVPLLGACGDDGDDGGTTDSGSDPTEGGTSKAPGGGDALAKTADVEVGGAVFLDEPSVVITQPTEGEFHAFERKCTHQGCPVTDILDGQIHCDCHDSLYSMTDGANEGGPAPEPLTEFAIKVQGGNILEG